MYWIVNRRIVCRQKEGYACVNEYGYGGCMTAIEALCSRRRVYEMRE
jgi:hypothetical protein